MNSRARLAAAWLTGMVMLVSIGARRPSHDDSSAGFQVGEKVQLDYGGYVRLPAESTAYAAGMTPDSRYGCIRSPDGFMIHWSAVPLRQGEDLATAALVWSKSERMPQFELRYFLTRSRAFDVLVVESSGLTLMAGVRGQPEIDRVLKIGRSWTPQPGRCPDCVPYRAEPPRRGDADATFEGCSDPLIASFSGPISASQSKLGPPMAEIDRWRRAFTPIDVKLQTFAVGSNWALQPSCADGTLSGVTVYWSPSSPSAGLMNTTVFRETLERIDQVRALGASDLTTNLGVLESLRTKWPMHAQFEHAVLDASVFGGESAGIGPFSIWYYRPISGVIQSLRGPIASDRRAVLQIKGRWYWTSESTYSTLRRGQTVRDLLAAGPIEPNLHADVATCGK